MKRQIIVSITTVRQLSFLHIDSKPLFLSLQAYTPHIQNSYETRFKKKQFNVVYLSIAFQNIFRHGSRTSHRLFANVLQVILSQTQIIYRIERLQSYKCKLTLTLAHKMGIITSPLCLGSRSGSGTTKSSYHVRLVLSFSFLSNGIVGWLVGFFFCTRHILYSYDSRQPRDSSFDIIRPFRQNARNKSIVFEIVSLAKKKTTDLRS